MRGTNSSDDEHEHRPYTTAAPPEIERRNAQQSTQRTRPRTRQRRNDDLMWTPPHRHEEREPEINEIPIRPAREARRMTVGANGERYTETRDSGTIPLWQEINANNRARIDNDYNLDRTNLEYGFQDRMNQRQHDYDMAALEADENIDIAEIEAMEREYADELQADLKYGEWDYNLRMEDTGCARLGEYLNPLVRSGISESSTM